MATSLINEFCLAGSAASNRDDMKTLLNFSKTYNVTHLNEYFKFEEFPEAFEIIAKGKLIYRVVVDVKSYGKNKIDLVFINFTLYLQLLKIFKK